MSTEVSEALRGKDWAGSLRAYLIAWGIPSLILIGAAFVGPVPRTLVWSGVLVWMGAACLMNARRCGRTHCSYTGPYYLILIIPVTLHGFGAVPLGQWTWWVLGALILLGAKVIWIGTEVLWGRYWPVRYPTVFPDRSRRIHGHLKYLEFSSDNAAK